MRKGYRKWENEEKRREDDERIDRIRARKKEVLERERERVSDDEGSREGKCPPLCPVRAEEDEWSGGQWNISQLFQLICCLQGLWPSLLGYLVFILLFIWLLYAQSSLPRRKTAGGCRGWRIMVCVASGVELAEGQTVKKMSYLDWKQMLCVGLWK